MAGDLYIGIDLGTTGIKVSKFGFGSHMRKDIVPFDTERERMIREAHDLGITLFERMEGEDPTALIGLPLIRLTDMLMQAGLVLP